MKKGEWDISIKSLITMRWQNRLPKLVIHEKYERLVKWFLRIITAIGIASSAVVLPIWYQSLSLAIVLFMIEQFVEKAILLYTSIYIQPMPDFQYDPNEWKGMAFAFPQDPDPAYLNVVGCAFASTEFAHKFFSLLRAWNYGEANDRDNNICLSFIVENDVEYTTYIYPNLRRVSVGQFFQEAEEHQERHKYGKEHQKLVMQMTFCHKFPFGADSQLKQFVEKQSSDRPFWMKPFVMKENGEADMVDEEQPILKYHYKFKDRRDLDKSEYEYQHGKNILRK